MTADRLPENRRRLTGSIWLVIGRLAGNLKELEVSGRITIQIGLDGDDVIYVIWWYFRLKPTQGISVQTGLK